ncbi:MAG: HIT family protein [Tenericutes bacterium]|nr:HIT family protein [Mycoplasmatota bacterium]
MCLLCERYDKKVSILYENETVFVIYDGYPVSEGHCLIVSKRHITDYFEASDKELRDIEIAIKHMKEYLDKAFKPDGYNIGMNCGKAAGQSIMHLHIHLIPRYHSDCFNPKGGVRGVIPGKQKY